MDTAHSFSPLLVVLLIAFVVPILLSRLKRVSIPIVVDELHAGIVAGRSGLAVVPPDAPFLIMLAFVALSETLGSEIILGAFLAGAIIGLLRSADDTELARQLDAIGYGFFIPIFFIKVGVEFNLPVLLASSGARLLVPFPLFGVNGKSRPL